MTSNHHTDEVFREKRIVKNPIKFKIPLNEEQKNDNGINEKNVRHRFCTSVI